MQTEPLLSIPLGTFLLIVLLVLVAVALVVALGLSRRSRGASSDVEIVSEVMEGLPFAAMIVAESGRVVSCNERAKIEAGVHPGDRLPAEVSGIVREAIESGMVTSANPSWPGLDSQLTTEVIPIRGHNESKQAFMFLRREDGEGRDRQLRQLLAGLSHELRTPLTAITGHLEILGSAGPEEDDLRRRSQSFISVEVARMTRLVEDLLRLSRLESAPLEIRPVNPRSMAEEAISELYGPAEKKDIVIRLKANPNVPRVSADPDRLKQVLINLLDNAVKFTPEGGSVEVTISLHNSDVRFGVTDTGPGIPAHDRSHVFDPFFRGSRTDLKGASGAGLGLTIAKSILEQHGSEITLESTVGEGTRFSFVLKRA